MNIPEEISKARGFLDSAEKENDSEGKATKIAKGMDYIESYIQNNPDISDELRRYITNLKRTYTRKLLEQLPSMAVKTEIDQCLQYIILIFLKLEKDIDYVIKQHPELEENYHKCMKTWSEFGFFDEIRKELGRI